MDIPDVRNCIKSFLEGCDLVYPKTEAHLQFEADIVAESKRRGYITPENAKLRPFISTGVSMACNAYCHQSHEIQLFVCFYTAFLIYMDDSYETDIEHILPYNHNFITGEPHNDIILNYFRELMLEAPTLFGMAEANIIISATLNWITGLTIEQEVRNAQV